MKFALDAAGKSVTANANAPVEAICPACGGRVKLRKRKLMGGGRTYYWRHQNQWGFKCRQRHTGHRNG